MTDFPAQTDPTTAADSAEARAIDGDPVSTATLVMPTPRGRPGGRPCRRCGAGGRPRRQRCLPIGRRGFNGAADRVNERLHEMAGRAGEAIAQATDEAGERISGATQAAVTRIRNNASLPASRGTTTIANEVVEKIAGIAARDVPGVYDLGGDTVRLLSSVREKLHLGEESKAQGIAVRLNGKEADLSITIVLEYGFVVSSVTDAVREKTISAVETLLGLEVTNVDILVDDIHVDHDGPVGDDASRAAGYSSGTQAIKVGG